MTNHHVIGRQRFDIRIRHQREAPALQHKLSDYYWEAMVPAMDALFSQLVGPEEHVHLDRLEIDLGNLSPEELLSDTFIQKVIEHLQDAINQQISATGAGVARRPLRLGYFDKWLYFLEFGHLPYEASMPVSTDEWNVHVFETLAIDDSAVRRLHHLISTKLPALRRLYLQFSDAFLQQLVGLYTTHKHEKLAASLLNISAEVALLVKKISAIIEQLKGQEASFDTPAYELALTHELAKRGFVLRTSPEKSKDLVQWIIANRENLRAWSESRWQSELRQTFWRIVLEEVIIRKRKHQPGALISLPLNSALFRPLLPYLGSEAISETSSNSLAVQKAEKDALAENQMSELQMQFDEIEVAHDEAGAGKDDVFFIQNAGIVLLHPFFKHLFDRLELCQEDNFKDAWRARRAVTLLHFIASGELSTPEYQLLLPKLICGLPFNTPLEIDAGLKKEEINEAEHMMQAAIAHWQALGSVSPDGLREGFLQREGKLTRGPLGWILKVESKTIDVLLDKLPWNLSLIKMPWMKDMLKVEWR